MSEKKAVKRRRPKQSDTSIDWDYGQSIVEFAVLLLVDVSKSLVGLISKILVRLSGPL